MNCLEEIKGSFTPKNLMIFESCSRRFSLGKKGGMMLSTKGLIERWASRLIGISVAVMMVLLISIVIQFAIFGRLESQIAELTTLLTGIMEGG